MQLSSAWGSKKVSVSVSTGKNRESCVIKLTRGLIIHGFTRSDQRSEGRIVRDVMNTAEQKPNSTVVNEAGHNALWSTSSCRCVENLSKKRLYCFLNFLRNCDLETLETT